MASRPRPGTHGNRLSRRRRFSARKSEGSKTPRVLVPHFAGLPFVCFRANMLKTPPGRRFLWLERVRFLFLLFFEERHLPWMGVCQKALYELCSKIRPRKGRPNHGDASLQEAPSHQFLEGTPTSRWPRGHLEDLYSQLVYGIDWTCELFG